jgi:hypothetical protein
MTLRCCGLVTTSVRPPLRQSHPWPLFSNNFVTEQGLALIDRGSSPAGATTTRGVALELVRNRRSRIVSGQLFSSLFPRQEANERNESAKIHPASCSILSLHGVPLFLLLSEGVFFLLYTGFGGKALAEKLLNLASFQTQRSNEVPVF